MIRPMLLTTARSMLDLKTQSTVFRCPGMTMLDQHCPMHLLLEAKLAHRLQHTMKIMTTLKMVTVPQNSQEVCVYVLHFRKHYMHC